MLCQTLVDWFVILVENKNQEYVEPQCPHWSDCTHIIILAIPVTQVNVFVEGMKRDNHFHIQTSIPFTRTQLKHSC